MQLLAILKGLQQIPSNVTVASQWCRVVVCQMFPAFSDVQNGLPLRFDMLRVNWFVYFIELDEHSPVIFNRTVT